MSRATASAGILSDRIRRIVIEQSKRANVGHIGSSLSVADILGTLYAGVLRGDGPDDPERDRFVLSKGHASLALYAALHETGVIDSAELSSFCVDGSRLGTHPDHVLPGVDFSTGSLGHGLSLATGSALAARLSGSDRRTYVLMSDAECNEGSVWEAVMFAAHHRLGEPRRRRRRQRPAGARLHARRDRPRAARRAVANLRLGRPRRRRTRSRRRCAPSSTGSPPATTGLMSCLRRRCSATASPTWSARSAGTTCPWTTTSTRPRCPSWARSRHAGRPHEAGIRDRARGARRQRPSRAPADGGPRVHGRRAVRRPPPRPLHQRRRGRAEHGRHGHGPRRGRVRPVRLLHRHVRRPALVRVHPQRSGAARTPGARGGRRARPRLRPERHHALGTRGRRSAAAAARARRDRSCRRPADGERGRRDHVPGRAGVPAPGAHGPGHRRARRPLRDGPSARARRRRRHCAGRAREHGLHRRRDAAPARRERRGRARRRRLLRAPGAHARPRGRTGRRAARALGRIALRRWRSRLTHGRSRRRERPGHASRARGRAPLAGRRDGRIASSSTICTASRRVRSCARRSSISPASRGRCGALHEARRSHSLAAGADPRARRERLRRRQSGAGAARAPLGRGRDDEPDAGLAARGSARRQRARVRRARRAECGPNARRGAAADGVQLHRLRRVLVRDGRRADPAHEPDEHARAAGAPRDAQSRGLHPRRQLVGVRRERRRAGGARVPGGQQRLRRLQGRLRAPHPLLRQAPRSARAPTCASTPSTARSRIPLGSCPRSCSTACAASCRRSWIRASRAISSTATTSSTRSWLLRPSCGKTTIGDSFNIGTGRQTTIGELAEIARELYGIDRPASFTMPRAALGHGRLVREQRTRAHRPRLGGADAARGRSRAHDRVVPGPRQSRALPQRDQGGRAGRRAQRDGRDRVLPRGQAIPVMYRAADGDVHRARRRLRDHLRQRRQPRRQRAGDPRDQRARPARPRHLALAQFRLAGRLPQRHGACDEERRRAARTATCRIRRS